MLGIAAEPIAFHIEIIECLETPRLEVQKMLSGAMEPSAGHIEYSKT